MGKSEIAKTIKANTSFLILTIVFATTMVTLIVVTGRTVCTEPNGKFATADQVKISFLASLLNQAKQKLTETFNDFESGLSEKITEEKRSDVFADIAPEVWEDSVKILGWDKTYKEVSKKWGPVIKTEAKKYKVNPRHVMAIIVKESAGNPNAVNYDAESGAWGLMQLLFSTAKIYGATSTEDLLDPEYNIHLGVRRLAKAKESLGDDPSAILAYHYGETGGPRRVRQYGQSPEKSNDWQLVQAIIRTGEKS